MEYMGLRWYMCDFHLHSMTSQCYKERDNDTIDMWVEEAKRKGIQCVAITDHMTIPLPGKQLFLPLGISP